MNLIHLTSICDDLRIGKPLSSPQRIHGNRSGHCIWLIKTSKGNYVIKQLANDLDLTNQNIINKYELTESIAYQFSIHGVPSVPALDKNGKHVFIIDDVGYLIYPYIESYVLDQNKISETHALKIAELTAKIHRLKLNMPIVGPPRLDIHSSESISETIKIVQDYSYPFYEKLKEKENLIQQVNNQYLSIIPILKENTVITHGDLDQQNVLWNKEDHPILIDWESAKRMNPTREIVRTSLGWSGVGTNNSSKALYKNMLVTYANSGGPLNQNQIKPGLFAVFGSQINWLLYNITILSANDSPRSKESALENATQAVDAITRFNDILPDLLI